MQNTYTSVPVMCCITTVFIALLQTVVLTWYFINNSSIRLTHLCRHLLSRTVNVERTGRHKWVKLICPVLVKTMYYTRNALYVILSQIRICRHPPPPPPLVLFLFSWKIRNVLDQMKNQFSDSYFSNCLENSSKIRVFSVQKWP